MRTGSNETKLCGEIGLLTSRRSQEHKYHNLPNVLYVDWGECFRTILTKKYTIDILIRFYFFFFSREASSFLNQRLDFRCEGIINILKVFRRPNSIPGPWLDSRTEFREGQWGYSPGPPHFRSPPQNITSRLKMWNK